MSSSLNLNSVAKLVSTLTPHQCIVRKQLLSSGTVSYISIYSIASADHFLLYIPSSIEMAPISEIPSEKISEIDPEDGDILNTTKTPEIEEQYQSIDLGRAGASDQETLEKPYKVSFSLKDPDQKEALQLAEISRQLRRLKYTVKDIPYKIAIYYKTYLCTIHRSNDIVFYKSKVDHGNRQKLVVTIDLESFPEQLPSIHRDISTVRNAIYNIIEKNQLRNLQVFYSLSETNQQFQTVLPLLTRKRQKYNHYLTQLEELLEGVIRAENNNRQKLEESQSTKVDLHSVDLTSKLHAQKLEISRAKQKVLEDITYIKTAKDNLDLKLDTVLFDNNLMLDRVRSGLEDLIALAE